MAGLSKLGPILQAIVRLRTHLAIRSNLRPLGTKGVADVDEVPDPHTGRGVRARHALQGAWGPGRRRPSGHKPSPPRGEDRYALPRLWPADQRARLGG